MSALTQDDVKQIARLARLELEESELERLRGELSSILEHVELIQELDTDAVEPMTHAVEVSLRLRSDEPIQPLSQKDALAGAPDTFDSSFRVPHIIDSAEGE